MARAAMRSRGPTTFARDGESSLPLTVRRCMTSRRNLCTGGQLDSDSVESIETPTDPP